MLRAPQPSPARGCSGRQTPHATLSLIALFLLCALGALRDRRPHASHSQSTTLDGPRDLLDANARPKALDDAASLGVKSLRIVLTWQGVAPDAASRVKPKFDATDPAAYDWSRYDALVDAAQQRGWKVLMTPSGPTPRWATNGARTTSRARAPTSSACSCRRRPRTSTARSTPGASGTSPTSPSSSRPQYSARHNPLSPRIYRNLFFAAVRGLRNAGQGAKPVLIGETSPRGTGKVVPPLTFLRGALCLDSRYRKSKKCAAVPATGYAHHAYTTGQGPTFHPPQPNDVTIGVLSRLTSALSKAKRAGATTRTLPVWLTEFGIESTPDPLRGVSLQKQSEYRSISERIAYDNPHVVSFNQYLLRDDLPKEGVPKVPRYPGFETGLFTSAGKAEAELRRLPPAARRVAPGGKISLWGFVRRPAARRRRRGDPLQRRAWRHAETYTTDARGYFTRTVSTRRPAVAPDVDGARRHRLPRQPTAHAP